MANFLNFINDDIIAKKTLLSTLPTKTKANIKNYNDKINSIIKDYESYKESVRKYLIAKNNSFEIDKNYHNVDVLKKEIEELEQIRLLLNPTNTFFEKMGFDTLLYNIRNYSDFNFTSMNEIINEFLTNFEKAGIILTVSDFDYTYYVREYMSSFLDIRNSTSRSFDMLSKTFEEIYWENPNLIQQIELNFRKLIKKNRRKFDAYIANAQKEIMWKNNIGNYKDCINKLKIKYSELEENGKEDIADIIELAKKGELEINNFFEGSRVMETTYQSLTIEQLDLNNKQSLDNFYANLKKLKDNINEYNNYLTFMPLFENFKNEFRKPQPSTIQEPARRNISKLRAIETKINEKENILAKLNRNLFSTGRSFFGFKNDIPPRQIKQDSIILSSELYKLYNDFDQELFREKVKQILNDFLTVPELLHLYYSFDYFKKKDIKKAFNLEQYDEIIQQSKKFDEFAKNPNNLITNGVSIFSKSDISKIIVNKYRLDNINITEENLEQRELESLLNQIEYLLRIEKINKSETTVEKIWFMVKVTNILKKEEEEKKKKIP